MILITSAAYIDLELQSEFGRLPPAFLPVGNKHLFFHQVDILKSYFNDEAIYMSIPESFIVSDLEREFINNLNISIVSIPDKLRLSDSILYAINSIGNYSEGIRILHGDTLIYDLPLELDTIAVAQADSEYQWYIESSDDEGYLAWAGYFSFKSVALLGKALVASAGDFEKAVISYGQKNKLTRSLVENWLDFDHVNTFYNSRSKITTQRSFNELKIINKKIYKSSKNSLKIKAEAKWFESIPPQLRVYTPQLLNHGELLGNYFYELEYLFCAPLNEVYVYGRHNVVFWDRIFSHIKQWFNDSRSTFHENIKLYNDSIIEKNFIDLIDKKTKHRIFSYLLDRGISQDSLTYLNSKELPSLNVIIDQCVNLTSMLPSMPGIMHGDLCFSNILMDSRSDSIKLLDPRGVNNDGTISIVGDLRYDLAKLAHSVYGMYDYIISGAYYINKKSDLNYDFYINSDDNLNKIKSHFINYEFLSDIPTRSILPLCVLLFLSMLPLHSDKPERQDAMLANALRIYSLILEEQ